MRDILLLLLQFFFFLIPVAQYRLQAQDKVVIKPSMFNFYAGSEETFLLEILILKAQYSSDSEISGSLCSYMPKRLNPTHFQLSKTKCVFCVYPVMSVDIASNNGNPGLRNVHFDTCIRL